MHLLRKTNYHELFRIAILVKAVDGFIEICAGIFLYFVNFATIGGVFFLIFHEEVAENPRDAFWGFIIKEWHSLSLSGHSFWGLLFFAHGITKLALSVALLKNQLWAYPVAAGVFTLFVAYEIYAITNQPSLFLWLITIFDVIVVGLILNEYRRVIKK
jgi:uncharacterized membrane protein